MPGAGDELARLDACDAPKTLHADASTQKNTSGTKRKFITSAAKSGQLRRLLSFLLRVIYKLVTVFRFGNRTGFILTEPAIAMAGDVIVQRLPRGAGKYAGKGTESPNAAEVFRSGKDGVELDVDTLFRLADIGDEDYGVQVR